MNHALNEEGQDNPTGDDAARRDARPPEQGQPGQRPRSQRGSPGQRAGDGSAPRARAGDSAPGGRPPKRSGPPGGPPEGRDGRDGRKRRKDGSDRRGLYGFGDAIERATCTSYSNVVPETWPVQSRPGIATLRAIEVDRRTAAVLYCDGAHAGPHIWPDGEIVVSPEDRPHVQPESNLAPQTSTDDTVRDDQAETTVAGIGSVERNPETTAED